MLAKKETTNYTVRNYVNFVNLHANNITWIAPTSKAKGADISYTSWVQQPHGTLNFPQLSELLNEYLTPFKDGKEKSSEEEVMDTNKKYVQIVTSHYPSTK